MIHSRKEFVIHKGNIEELADSVNWIKKSVPKIEKDLSVVITEHISDYTASQSGYFHVCCRILGKELGYTEGDIKRLVKKELWDTDMVSIGRRTLEVYKSMEKGKANKLDYSDAIECVLRIAAEVNVYLPEAGDRR